MAIASSTIKKKSSTKERKTIDLSNIEDLKTYAQDRGLKVKENKPSLFRRTLDVLSRPLYTSANVAKDIVDKGEFHPFKSAWRGFTGKDKTTYSDVLGEMGVENKWVKGGVGFAMDVALDPITYFGGTAIKAGLKTTGKIAKPIAKGYSKIAPESSKYFEAAGKNLKDAFGSAFKYGYGASKGLADDVSLALNKIGIAKEDVIDDTIKAFGKKPTKAQMTRAADIMYENRLIERGIKNGSYKYPQNPETRRLLEVMKKKGQEIAKKADIKKGDKWYYPGIDVERLKKGSDKAGVLKIGQEGYYKQFRGLIKDENLLKKPIEAYSRREFEVVRDGITRHTLKDLVETYGSKTAKEGFTEIKDKKFGKVVGYLKEKDAKFINDYLFPEFKTIDVLSKGLGYDKFTNTFKAAVTAYFPAFHIRNYISGNVQNYQALGIRALAPSNVPTALAILKGANKQIKLGNKLYNTKALNKVLKDNFRGASRYISDLGEYIDEIAGTAFKLKKLSKARSVGNFIEMNQKTVAMVTALKQGKTIKEAVKLAEKAGFDYSKITKFESKIMRRLVPFYTFARKNASLQLSTFKNHPERILNQAKFANMLSNAVGGKVTDEDLKGGDGPQCLDSLKEK